MVRIHIEILEQLMQNTHDKITTDCRSGESRSGVL